jgi:hypothetical protein
MTGSLWHERLRDRLRWCWCWAFAWLVGLPLLVAIELWDRVRSHKAQEDTKEKRKKSVRITCTLLSGEVVSEFDADAWLGTLRSRYLDVVTRCVPDAEIAIDLRRNGTIGYIPNVRVEVVGMLRSHKRADVKCFIEQAAEIAYVEAWHGAKSLGRVEGARHPTSQP